MVHTKLLQLYLVNSLSALDVDQYLDPSGGNTQSTGVTIPYANAHLVQILGKGTGLLQLVKEDTILAYLTTPTSRRPSSTKNW